MEKGEVKTRIEGNNLEVSITQDWDAVLAKYAGEHGKTVADLTEDEKRQVIQAKLMEMLSRRLPA